jgi:hypothetical protein
VRRPVGKVVPRCARNGDNFGKRIAADFAGFGLDGIQNRFTLTQDEVMKTTYSLCAILERPLFPGALGISSGGNGGLNFGWNCKLNVSNDFPGCWISYFDNISFFASEL